MRIDLGSVQINNDVADVNGAKFYVDRMEGWDSPALRQEVISVAGRHGGVLGESVLDARSVILSGICKAPNTAAFHAAYNGLLGTVNNLFTPISLKVYETGDTKELQVIRGGQVRLDYSGVNAFRFEIPLLALDPVKKSVTVGTFSLTPGGSNSVAYAGNFESFPTVTVTSAGTVDLRNLSVSASASVSSTVSLPVGAVIDFAKRTLKYADGSDHYSLIFGSSVWWAFQPGTNTIQHGGTSSVSYSYRNGWI